MRAPPAICRRTPTSSSAAPEPTFPAPLYQKWLEEYHAEQSEASISYEAVGSGEGADRFIGGSVDFGASDAAMTDEDMERVKAGVQLIPVTAGSIVLAYHLPEAPTLQLSREVYAEIFLGKITSWNDERIQKLNPDAKLPKRSITVVARSDSSGTTYAFTNHLSAISEEWKNGPGVAKIIDWPGGAVLAKGNEGVAGVIKHSPGSLGYVEYGIAKRSGVQLAKLENKAGNFIEPSGSSGLATLINAELPENLRAFFPDPEGDDSYPIVTYSWLLLYQKYDKPERGEQVKKFVRWCLSDGQRHSEYLGYIRLAPRVVEKSLAAVDTIE